MPDDRFRYGILGTGNIAKQFAAGVAESRHSVVTAVGSRTAESASAFADKFGVDAGHAHGSYDALLADDAVDAVYVSLPNAMHAAWSIQAMEAGKHVLCEKPIASDHAEAVTMFDAAERTGRMLMEAFMYRCHPLTHAVVDAVRGGAVGTVKQVRASFCFNLRHTEGNVRFDPSLAGGAIMDVGCYALSFARLIAGEEPAELLGRRTMHASGVEDRASAVLRFPSGIDALVTCGMTLMANNSAWVFGDAGIVEVPVPWKPPTTGATWRPRGKATPRQEADAAGPDAKPAGPFNHEHAVDAGVPLYGLEADAFAAAARGEAPLPVTESDTLGNMAAIDAWRACPA